MGRRLTSLALGALATAVASAGPPGASAAWPTSGHGAISDGERVALLTADGSAVEIYRDAQRSGSPVGVPVPSSNEMRPVGVFGSRVLLAGHAVDVSTLKTPIPDDRLAIADTATGRWRWLCGPVELVGPPGPSCLRGNSAGGSIGPGELPTVISAGRRWINVWWTFDFPSRALIKWSEKDGRFQARWSTARERDRVYESVGKKNWFDGTPLTLSAKLVGPVTSGGFARRVRNADLLDTSPPRITSRSRVLLRRSGDRRFGTLLVYGSSSSSVTATSGVGFSPRGACVTSRSQVAVWDKRTRRVWTRRIDTSLAPAEESAGPYVVCAGSSVLVISRSAVPGYVPTITALRWPSDRRHAGWRKGSPLRPGKTRTIR